MNPKSQSEHPKEKKTENQKSDKLKSYTKYSGMAGQMIAIILIMTYTGVWLDERRGAETPVFTLILSLLGVFSALYVALKDFIGKK